MRRAAAPARAGASQRILALTRNAARRYYPLPPMQARNNVPLAPLTTLQLGGVASRFVDIEREDHIVDALSDAQANTEPVLVLGRGSNVVVADEGFAGLVVHMATRGVEAHTDGDRVVV